MKKPILYIKKREFCGWYFDKSTDESVVNLLLEKGKISIEDFLEGVGYLPLRLISNKKDIRKKDIDDDEIEEPYKNYILKFK